MVWGGGWSGVGGIDLLFLGMRVLVLEGPGLVVVGLLHELFCVSSPGHLIGPVLCHSFCNYMGFPAVCAALEHPQRRPLLAGYALGVGLFLLLLQPLTDPKLYGSLPLCVLLERAGDSEAPLCS